jgi:hypothetical protein
VDHRAVGSGAIGPVAAELRFLYLEATRGHLANYRHWLLPAFDLAPAEAAQEPVMAGAGDGDLWGV